MGAVELVGELVIQAVVDLTISYLIMGKLLGNEMIVGAHMVLLEDGSRQYQRGSCLAEKSDGTLIDC